MEIWRWGRVVQYACLGNHQLRELARARKHMLGMDSGVLIVIRSGELREKGQERLLSTGSALPQHTARDDLPRLLPNNRSPIQTVRRLPAGGNGRGDGLELN